MYINFLLSCLLDRYKIYVFILLWSQSLCPHNSYIDGIKAETLRGDWSLGGALMNEVSALMGETPESAPPSIT